MRILIDATKCQGRRRCFNLYPDLFEEGQDQKGQVKDGVQEVPEEKVEPEEEDVTIPQPTDVEAAQKAAERCEQLYRDLDLYKGSAEITDSEGNAVVISPEMREAKINEINAELDHSCR